MVYYRVVTESEMNEKFEYLGEELQYSKSVLINHMVCVFVVQMDIVYLYIWRFKLFEFLLLLRTVFNLDSDAVEENGSVDPEVEEGSHHELLILKLNFC